MNMDKNTVFQQLQLMEQNLQVLMSQKQQFVVQQAELDSAMAELNKKPSKSYKIIGNIMVATQPEDLLKDMGSKKEVLAMRIQSLERQETKLRERAKEMQDSLMDEMKQDIPKKDAANSKDKQK